MNSDIILQPGDQLTHFDPIEYLRQYYGSNDMSRGLKIILCFLPNIAARLPKVERFLDIGSGPTIFMAVGFRNKADHIYLSDYAEQNRRELLNWLNQDEKTPTPFDWSAICKAIAKLECVDSEDWRRLEQEAKEKVRDVLYCDVHQPEVLTRNVSMGQFDIVSAVFCLEYASSNSAEYRRAMTNACRLIKPGGWLILGGAFEESYYTLGKKRFKCHYLTEAELFEALRDAGILIEDRSFAYYCHNDAFVVVGKMGDL